MTPVLAMLALCGRIHQFPRGATYYAKLGIPLIGHQHVKLIVRSGRIATVSLDGLVRCDGDVVYTMDDDGIVEFKTDGDLHRLMSRYGCSVTDGRYDFATDTAHITIRLRMLALVRKLQLQRIFPSATASDSISTRIAQRIVHPIVLGLQNFCREHA